MFLLFDILHIFMRLSWIFNPYLTEISCISLLVTPWRILIVFMGTPFLSEATILSSFIVVIPLLYTLLMLTAIIISFILTAVSFTLGVSFTIFLSKSDIYERVVDRLHESTKKIPEAHLGIIERPTRKEIDKTKAEEETEEEMAKELRKFYSNDSSSSWVKTNYSLLGI